MALYSSDLVSYDVESDEVEVLCDGTSSQSEFSLVNLFELKYSCHSSSSWLYSAGDFRSNTKPNLFVNGSLFVCVCVRERCQFS